MPRPFKKRCCRNLTEEKIFKPVMIPLSDLEVSDLRADEFEALRICDLEGKNQIQAAQIMEISRGTIQRLLNSGRKKIINALLENQAIRIRNQ
ncbi:MAG: DUF134 domain-containing protein [Spirochaetes bacterium]|nr:DUF134 domain-containing protein [Spirochaetota bacterium]